MAQPDANDGRTKVDQILDLLLDALAERQASRKAAASPSEAKPVAQPPPEPAPRATTPEPSPPRAAQGALVDAVRVSLDTPNAPGRPRPTPPAGTVEPSARAATPLPAELPPRRAAIGLNRTLARLTLIVACITLLINIPVGAYGRSLARILPDTTALIIRDGLVLKGSGPEIYRLEADKLRWISSMEAFEHLGLEWRDVHIVEDRFLDRFEVGKPIHVLLKCSNSPHIYRLEGGEKRWIKDIATFEAEGHVWDDVRLVPCERLRELPDGPPIPEDAGAPPSP